MDYLHRNRIEDQRLYANHLSNTASPVTGDVASAGKGMIEGGDKGSS